MTNYEVGYKKPPRKWQFKPGNRANPEGRGKRKLPSAAAILRNVMNSQAEFWHRGKSKRAPRIELAIKRIGEAALKADISAAAELLRMRAHFDKHGDINPERIKRITVIIVDPEDVERTP